MKKEKLEGISFFEKYLSVWVAFCIIAGVAIGKFLPQIPNFLSRFEYAQVSIPIAILIWLMIFPMMLGMMLVSEFLVSRIPIEGEFFGPLYDQMSDAFSTIATDTAGIYLLTVLFAPFLEEILFRGIIQKGLINKGVKPAKAIIFSALAFGIFHLNPWQTVNAFLLGLVLGVVYYKTKSLLMPILLHAFNNFISAYLLLNGNSESVTENLHLPEYYGLIVGIVLLSVSYYLFMYRNRIYYRE